MSVKILSEVIWSRIKVASVSRSYLNKCFSPTPQLSSLLVYLSALEQGHSLPRVSITALEESLEFVRCYISKYYIINKYMSET